jgi:hypothetical protein
MTTTYTTDQAINTLVNEGFSSFDAEAAFNSLVDAGLDLDQPDDGYVITSAELDVLRAQLNS